MPTCPICREEMHEVVENYHYFACGLKNVTLVGIRVRHCAACGNTMPLIPNLVGLHDAIARTVINNEGRLSPEEIVFLRKHLGWSAADFAGQFHCDRAQISKWENGRQPMSKPNELLLREKVARGKKIDDYHSVEVARKKDPEVRAIRLQPSDRQKWQEAA